METNGLITLQTCVDDVLNKLDNYSDSLIGRYLRFAERGLSKLSLFVLDGVRTKEIPINMKINTADLPSDFVRLIRLGVNVHGKYYTLTRNDDIIIRDEFSCQETPRDSDDNGLMEGYPCSVGNESGYNYQLRGGQSEYGSYRIDPKENVIYFGEDVRLENVIVEYVGTGININDVTYIPEMAREAIIAFIMKERLHSGNSTLGERQEAEYNWNTEQNLLVTAQMPSLDEMYDTILSLNTPLIVR